MSYKDKIIAYLQLKRRGKGANELERKAMRDTFLNDALDGYNSVENEEQLLADIAHLQTQLNSRVNKRKFNIRMIAAVIVVCLLSGVGYWALKTETALNDSNKNLLTEDVETKDSIEHPDKNIQSSRGVTIVEKPKDDNIQGQLADVTKKEKIQTPEIAAELETESTDLLDFVLETDKALGNTGIKEDTSLEAFEKQKENTSSVKVATENKTTLSTSPSTYKRSTKKEDKFKPSLQNKVISGTVQDSDDGEDLAFATVVVKGTSIATVSDNKGNFKLQIPESMDSVTLVFSYIGYENLEQTIKDASTVAVTLTPHSTALEEVVVTGYAARQRSSITGAVSTIKVKDVSTTEEVQPLTVDVRLIDKQGATPVMGKNKYKKQLEEKLLTFHKNTSSASQLEGTVRVSFTLNNNGYPTDIILIKGIDPKYDNKVIDVIKTLGDWTLPNKDLAKPIQVRVYFGK